MIKSEKIITKLFFENAKKDLNISNERLELLSNIAKKISNELEDRDKVNLNFICTHNSRRSQLCQTWSFYASEHFKLGNILAFSGGTETTAFHRNTVKTLQKVGFEFNIIDFSHQNPKYLISFKETKKNVLGFSKKFDNDNNHYPYIAITNCEQADKNCHFIPDALARFHLPYIDLKGIDNTPLQKEKYLELNQLVAAEIFIIFEKITNQINKKIE